MAVVCLFHWRLNPNLNSALFHLVAPSAWCRGKRAGFLRHELDAYSWPSQARHCRVSRPELQLGADNGEY